MREIAIVYALFGDSSAAETIAAQMIEQRLAACANLQAGCVSFYRWQGVTERAAETPVIFKTSLARRAALMEAIAQAHEYEIPAISGWEATTADDYADWVEAETSTL